VKVITEVIQVKPFVYNCIRSFLESSEKEDKPWNTGALLPLTHHVIFTKRKKWILNICHHSANLFTYDYRQVFLLYRSLKTLTIDDGIYVDVSNDNFIVPEPPVSNYIPIQVRDIVGKIKMYMRALEQVIKTDWLSCRERC